MILVTPFIFKFDETATLQVKKHYDAYIQYWYKEMNLVNSVYCGSLFGCHCFSKVLLHHFTTFVEDMNRFRYTDANWNGWPNVNSKFEKDLYTQIYYCYGVSFLMLGSCGIHITNNGFGKGVTEFGFDVDICE